MSIDTLPDDLLVTIFRLVHSIEPCALDYPYSCSQVPPGPEHLMALTHVCSRWRQVATSLGSLWTHLDFPSRNSDWQLLLDRAEIFANWAGDSPLHLHIPTSKFTPRWDECSARIKRFSSLVASRIARLEVTLPPFEYNSTHQFESETRMLNTVLAGCIPGVLTKLRLKRQPPHYPGNVLDEVLRLDALGGLHVSQDHLEALLSHVTSLWLEDHPVKWTSKAYHNLVELYVRTPDATSARMPLTELQLVEVLKASPGLRAIYLYITITDTLPAHTQVTPVLLESLEALSIISDNNHNNIIRWFAPGRLPLHLSLIHPLASIHHSEFTANGTTAEFLQRSNTVALGIENMGISARDISETLWLSPNLRAIELWDCRVWLHHLIFPWAGRQHSCVPSCLLYMNGCEMDSDVPRWISDRSLIKKIFLAGCTISDNSNAPSDDDEMRSRLDSNPGVEFISPAQEQDFKLPVGWGWSFEWLGQSKANLSY